MYKVAEFYLPVLCGFVILLLLFFFGVGGCHCVEFVEFLQAFCLGMKMSIIYLKPLGLRILDSIRNFCLPFFHS